MVDLIAGVGGGLFVLVSLIVGGRLLFVGFRTRQVPELAIGAGLALSAGIGYPLLVTAQMAKGLPDDARIALFAGHALSNILGLGGLAYFTRHVFRPNARWAQAAWIVLAGSLVVAAVLQLRVGALSFVDANSGPWSLNIYLGLAVLLWAGTESLLHYGQLKRRVALGLAEPIVADRLRLWGIAMLDAATISASMLILEALGVKVIGTMTGALITGPLGLVAGVCVHLAFMPPKFYLQWVERRWALRIASAEA